MIENRRIIIENIDVLYHADIPSLKQTERGDWIDLRCAEDTVIPGRAVAKVSFGISMRLPDGYEAHVLPRSSLHKHFGVIQTNSMGIIDNSYCGPKDIWFVELYNINRFTVVIPKDARICQFRIVKKMPKIRFNNVYSLNSANRDGHGSSGIY